MTVSPPAPAALPAGLVVLERGWLSSNTIIALGRESAAVVDTGYATHAQQTVDLVTSVIGTKPLTLIANTHLHSDHCGGNAALQAAHPQAKTAVPVGLAGAVSAWDQVALTYAPTGQQCPRFLHQEVLQPGGRVQLGDVWWQVHAAPGHDPHSVILYEADSRCLISADALWENGFGVVFPELEGEQAFAEVGETLDLIETLAPVIVIPGHGSPFSDLGGALARARSRLAAYLASPPRHASHAAKVLLKFKLLELQDVEEEHFVAWASRTPYFGMVHSRWFAGETMQAWLNRLIAELCASQAARRENSRLLNI